MNSADQRHHRGDLGRKASDARAGRQPMEQARAGSQGAISELTEACRQYLLMIANAEIDSDVRPKVGASDIVQEALLTAQQDFKSFGGASEPQLLGWVRQILLNKIASSHRFYRQTARRDVNRERPIPGGSGNRHELIDPHPTPREGALSNEIAELVKRTVSQLPDRDQQLIKLRSFEQRSFAEIGERLAISADAARKAWYRAVDRFREEWQRACTKE